MSNEQVDKLQEIIVQEIKNKPFNYYKVVAGNSDFGDKYRFHRPRSSFYLSLNLDKMNALFIRALKKIKAEFTSKSASFDKWSVDTTYPLPGIWTYIKKQKLTKRRPSIIYNGRGDVVTVKEQPAESDKYMVNLLDYQDLICGFFDKNKEKFLKIIDFDNFRIHKVSYQGGKFFLDIRIPRNEKELAKVNTLLQKFSESICKKSKTSLDNVYPNYEKDRGIDQIIVLTPTF